MSKPSLGLYLHIPFCLQKCLYCDFCSFPAPQREQMEAYVEELCARIVQAAKQNREKMLINSIYFGGGTPSLMTDRMFRRLLGCIHNHCLVTDDCEITVECNPATVDPQKLILLSCLGVNRLSIGLQSANDRELSRLGRLHTFADFRQTFLEAREAGFDNISVDLMYGIPDQTLDSFRHTLDAVLALSPEHISAYGLKIEEGTPFASQRSTLSLPDEDTEFAMYRLCTELLEENGYQKYEISNFAKAGKESRHNLRYWKQEEYLGFGVAAHSCIGGERFGNSRSISDFLAGKDITAERTVLTDQDIRNEYIMLRLRLTEGLSLSDYQMRFGNELETECPAIASFLQGGFLKKENGRLSFTDRGFFVSNTILSELLT
ncbi:MAG: radical SAM family heme chaperone HemW [Ruminococcaceae bacterium]|nr:radical SAM family heme chaperone HemW [Oscillospiraceae bacterium]